MTTDDTQAVQDILDANDTLTDEELLDGNEEDSAPPPPIATFDDILQKYAAMNGNMYDNIIADRADLAGLPKADRLRLFAFLSNHGTPDAMLQELRGVLDKETRKKSNRTTENSAVTLAISKDIAKWKYDLWLNDMDDSIWNGATLFTDAQRATMRMTARDASYAERRLLSALDDAVLHIAHSNVRHPLRDYLNSLTWDGGDHIAKLAGYFTDNHNPIVYENETPNRSVFHAFLFRWLVGSVAKIYGDRNAARDNKVFVLAATQGVGKSHFASFLCPRSEFFVERHVNPDDKDTSLLRARAWIWEIGELGATTKRADVEMLKNHITATTVTERKAYGHFDTVKPCIASYVGTVNPDGAGFLVDTSGNRRFAVVELASIDWAYSTAIDIGQVWAQAVVAWQQDKRAYRFTDEEIAVQATNADVHLEPDMYGDMLAQTFDIGKVTGSFDMKMSSTDMLRYLRKYAGLSHGSEKSQGRELARSLAHHWGITPLRSHGRTIYWGVSLNAEYTAAEAAQRAAMERHSDSE